MPCGTLLFQPPKIGCKAMGSRLPRRTVGCSNFIANAIQPQGGHELGLSLSATSHIQFVPKRRVFPAQLAPSRRCVQALFACCGCRFRLHAPLHQATNTQVLSFGARDIEYTVFGRQHSLRQDCSHSGRRLRSWCEELCVLSASRRLRPHHSRNPKLPATATACRSSHP